MFWSLKVIASSSLAFLNENNFWFEVIKHKEESVLQIQMLEKQLETLQTKLDKFYQILETGKLDLNDLPPRIKELKHQIDQTTFKRNNVEINMKKPKVLSIDMKTLKSYFSDFMTLLSKGTLVEQKTFLRSFIKSITSNDLKIKVVYTFPLFNQGCKVLDRAVLYYGKIRLPE